jgi:hypothetical protein
VNVPICSTSFYTPVVLRKNILTPSVFSVRINTKIVLCYFYWLLTLTVQVSLKAWTLNVNPYWLTYWRRITVDVMWEAQLILLSWLILLQQNDSIQAQKNVTNLSSHESLKRFPSDGDTGTCYSDQAGGFFRIDALRLRFSVLLHLQHNYSFHEHQVRREGVRGFPPRNKTGSLSRLRIKHHIWGEVEKICVGQ